MKDVHWLVNVRFSKKSVSRSILVDFLDRAVRSRRLWGVALWTACSKESAERCRVSLRLRAASTATTPRRQHGDDSAPPRSLVRVVTWRRAVTLVTGG
jgi:hypothetical protein